MKVTRSVLLVALIVVVSALAAVAHLTDEFSDLSVIHVLW